MTAATVLRHNQLPLAFPDLRAGQHAEVTATVHGATLVALDINVPDPGGRHTRRRGTVEFVTGDGVSFELRIDGAPVRGDGNSRIRSGSQNRGLADVGPGAAVEVDGRERTLYTYAAVVDILESSTASPPSSPGAPPSPPSPGPSPSPAPTPTPGPPAPGTPVTLSGTVQALAGSCPLLVLTVDGRIATSDVNTVFSGVACATVRVGDRVELSATHKADGSLAVTALRKI